tara:strand:+ start:524 stop:781 length:258 start_codon:yes stop_codon:yes gene_type:complete
MIMTEFKISNKKSLCCGENMKLDAPNSDIGICVKCGKLAFDKAKESRLSNNRHQGFKKIADDGLYNNTWGKKQHNYKFIGNRNKK